MSTTVAHLTALLRETITDPRGAAARVIALGVPRPLLWQALAAVVILGMLETYIQDALLPPGVDSLMTVFSDAPLMTTAIAFAATAAMVHAIHRVGRLFGGTGDLDGALAVSVWLQSVMLVFNFIQIVLMLLAPPLAALMGAVNLGLFLWLMTSFVATLHGFRALFPVFVMILVTGAMLGFAFFFILTMTGLIVPPEVADV